MAPGRLRMTRAVRFAPLALFLLVIAALVWRLATPADTDVPSKLEGQPLSAFSLPAALPDKPSVASADLATGKPQMPQRLRQLVRAVHRAK